jgi:hypothetical protein
MNAITGRLGRGRVEYAADQRRAILRRMLPATVGEIREAYPHVWPSLWYANQRGGCMECRTLYRDLHAIGAVCSSHVWDVPARREATA